MTDIEVVKLFHRLHGSYGRRIHSAHGARAQMLKLAPRLYKILLDGLAYSGAKEMLKCGHLRDEECSCTEIDPRAFRENARKFREAPKEAKP